MTMEEIFFPVICFIPDQQQSPFHAFKKCSSPSTFFAASRLSAMLNGSDEVYANRMVVDQVRFSEVYVCT